MLPARLPLLRSGFALLAIPLLAIQLADGSGVHRCPDHDSGLGVLALGAAPAGADHHGGDHDGSGQHQGPWPCLGACHAANVALAPAESAALHAAPVPAADPAPVPTPILRSQVPHLLPFALGPPLPA